MTASADFPPQLTSLNQWVVATEQSKLPIDAKTGEVASSTNPATWSDYQTASGIVSGGHASHLGFVFADNGIVGIDIDDGYDEDGFLSPLACKIIALCRSYTEKSRSGRGFHILVKGRLPFKGRNNLAGVEIYQTARYFIMTGSVLLHDEIIENQEAIDSILEAYFPDTRAGKDSSSGSRLYQPVWEIPTANRIPLRPSYPRIPDGCRNISLTSLAGALHNTGYTKRQIYDELVHANEVACTHPLSKGELRAICNSIARYRR